MTKWNCISIDPKIKEKQLAIRRCRQVRAKVQELRCQTYEGHVVIVCPHSHSKPEDCFRFNGTESTHIIAMPCCVPYNLERPIWEYQDKFVWSPCNTVKCWRI